MKYTCPCCGYNTLDEEPPGTFDICEICYWEDDHVQFEEPEFEGGANVPSLKQAQKNFIEFGACEKKLLEFTRKPHEEDIREAQWKPF